jgi:hypothetical protein
MKKTNKSDAPRKKVVKATREAVVSAAKHMQMFRQRTLELAANAERTWHDSKPRREKAQAELLKAAQEAMAFARDVQDGLKQGFAEIKKRNKKSR